MRVPEGSHQIICEYQQSKVNVLLTLIEIFGQVKPDFHCRDGRIIVCDRCPYDCQYLKEYEEAGELIADWYGPSDF
jgi:hypothetical protein